MAATETEAADNRELEPLVITQLAQALRIVAFSDCRVQDIDAIVSWIERRLEKPDLIIYAGDDIRRFIPDPETNYFEQLASLSRYGLVAVMGNDDLPENRSLIRGHRVYEVHSRPVAFGRFLVVGAEGSPLGIGITIYAESEIADHLRRSIPKDTDHTIIVVSHAPPKGCLDEAARFGIGQIGSIAVRDAVENDPRVALVVSGHAHLCGGHNDKLGHAVVLNAASHDDSFSKPANIATLLLHPNGVVEGLRWSEVLSAFPLASEINGIGRAYAERLAQCGITTVEQLADISPWVAGLALGRSPETAAILVARARSRQEGRPLLISTPELPKKPRLYLDIETDLQKSYTWLAGLATEDSDEVRHFFAPHPTEEGKMLQELTAFLSIKSDHSVMHFSGTNFDRRILVQRMESYDLIPPPSLLHSFDCLPALRSSLALPTRGMGLKEAAECFGYRFAHPEIDGWAVAYEYQKAVESGSPVPQRLLEYNRDDVLALRFLIHAVERLAAEI